MINLSTAILVGGQSRRMNGENKSFLMYQNQTFIERMITQLKPFDELLISVREREPYEKLGYPLIQDVYENIGPLSGLYECLKVCQQEYLFVCATDMPKLTTELILYMQQFISSDYDCYVIKAGGKRHPLCAIYKKSLLPMIEEMIEKKEHRLMQLLNRAKTKVISLEYSCFDESVVMNVNTKEEFDLLKEPAIFCVSGIKNSGKTTLITKIIKQLTDRNYRVGVIKHDGHEFEIDVENTDTHKHRLAGSTGTIIYSKTKYAVMKDWSVIDLELLISYLSDLDVIIMEGMKHSSYPKIEVVREGRSNEIVCDPNTLLAIATNTNLTHESVDVVSLDDIDQIMDVIDRKVLGGKNARSISTKN